MPHPIDRRRFLKHAAALPVLAAAPSAGHALPRERTAKIKLSCNLYSFNEPLTRGAMTLEAVIDFCAALGFDAVDPTGYYFTGYPDPPETAYVYEVKKRAFLLGLDVSGTGVRNDFTVPEASERAASVAHVKRWIDVAAALDAPVLRVFAGKAVTDGRTEGEVYDGVVECLQACTDYGRQRGVMIVLQNHNELLKTAEQVLRVRERVGSDWFGLNVDIGSLRTGDPYEEIARLAPYAYTWQIKENVYRGGKEEKAGLKKIVQILQSVGYRGYIPLETLGPGDPREKLPRFLDAVRQALA